MLVELVLVLRLLVESELKLEGVAGTGAGIGMKMRGYSAGGTGMPRAGVAAAGYIEGRASAHAASPKPSSPPPVPVPVLFPAPGSPEKNPGDPKNPLVALPLGLGVDSLVAPARPSPFETPADADDARENPADASSNSNNSRDDWLIPTTAAAIVIGVVKGLGHWGGEGARNC